MVRPLRQRRRRPAALLRVRSARSRRRRGRGSRPFRPRSRSVRALVGRPGEKDAAHARGAIQSDARRVLERLVVEAARLERCGDASGNAGPAHDAIERVPAVIEEDAAAGLRPDRRASWRRRPRSPRSPAGFSASASGRFARRRRRPRRRAPKSWRRSAHGANCGPCAGRAPSARRRRPRASRPRPG